MALLRLQRSFGRGAALSLAAVLWLCFAPPAAVASPEDPSGGGSLRTAALEEWKGRFCTAGSCRPRPASPMGATASLGAAILAARWLARRSAHQPPAPDSAAASPE